MINSSRKRGPNQHMLKINECIKAFEAGGPKEHIFIVDSEHLREMVSRAGHAMQALGYPALFSAHLAQVSLGNNGTKQGLGFNISYIPLNEDTIDRLRGKWAMVHALYENVPLHLQDYYMDALKKSIEIMNSRAELAA
jgi:hypothetical protein